MDGTVLQRHFESNYRTARRADVRAVDDAGLHRPRLDRPQRRPHAAGRHDPPGERIPQPQGLQVLPGVDAGRHRLGISEGDPLDRRVHKIVRLRHRAGPVGRHDDDEPVREQVHPPRRVDAARRRRALHLQHVGADEDVDRGAFDDLGSEHLGSGDVQQDADALLLLVPVRDDADRLGEAGRGRHEQRGRVGVTVTAAGGRAATPGRRKRQSQRKARSIRRRSSRSESFGDPNPHRMEHRKDVHGASRDPVPDMRGRTTRRRRSAPETRTRTTRRTI